MFKTFGILCGAAILAACGAGADESADTVPRSTVAAQPPSSATDTTPAATAPSESAPTPTEVPVLTSAPAPTTPPPPVVPPAGTPPQGTVISGGDLTFFESPSRNIGCSISAEDIRCDIKEKEFPSPAPPSDCDLDHGNSLYLTTEGTPTFLCHGDTVFWNGEPLAYGTSIRAGEMSCTSTEAGMVCWSIATGHGFVLARESYRLV